MVSIRSDKSRNSSSLEAIEDEELSEHVPPKIAGDIPGLVNFFAVTGSTRNADGLPVLNIRGDVAWDTEHGIALFFENGERLLQVGNLNDSCS